MKELAIRAAYDVNTFIDFPQTELKSDVSINRKFYLRVDVGPADDFWTEHFSVLVCTPEDRPRNDPSARVLVVREYNEQSVVEALAKTVKSCERDTWEHCLAALTKRFRLL